MTVLWAVLITAIVVVVLFNLATGEKKIERRVTHLYGVDGRAGLWPAAAGRLARRLS